MNFVRKNINEGCYSILPYVSFGILISCCTTYNNNNNNKKDKNNEDQGTGQDRRYTYTSLK